MSTLNFKSKPNKDILLSIIDEIIRAKYQISLNDSFVSIFNDIMDFVHSRFGKKSPEISAENHLKNINKICMDEAIKYIGAHVTYFPKVINSQKNNKSNIIKEPSLPVASSVPIGAPISTPTISPVSSMIPYQESTQNLFKRTDDSLNQMQFDRNNQSFTNFQTQPQPQGNTDQALTLALDQRRKDYGFMNYNKPDTQMGGGPNGPSGSNSSGGPNLLNILLQTSIAMQNPTILPNIISEINQMPHLVDLMSKDPSQFQAQVTNPNFLEMLVNQIKNKSDPRMKPMNLRDEVALDVPLITNGETGSVNSEYNKLVSMYQNGSGLDMTTTNNPMNNPMNSNNSNLLNHFIPPSEQLVNNTLPDLSQIHLIDYDLSLDFRTDLESVSNAKNQYGLKFAKFGNVSKVELTSCLIPESDFLMNEPYIYVKVEELGGRCYTSNHDNTFGKLILSENKNGYLHYVPDRGSCIQNFSQPVSFQKFTISFLNYNGKYISLKEISVTKSLKLKKTNKLKFITQYRHKLSVGDTIDIHIYRESEIDSYEVQVDSIIDDNTFTVDNVFETLTEHIVILRHTVNCSFKFKLYEINWNLLTKKNLQNAQLIRLSQLVTDRKKEALNFVCNDDEIVKYTQSQTKPPQQQQQPQQPQQPQPQLHPEEGGVGKPRFPQYNMS